MDRGSGSERMEVGNAVQRLVLGCLLTVFAGCGSGELDMSDGQSAQSADERPLEHAENAAKKTHVGADVPMLEQWSHSCALCHVDGNAGAPRLGNVEEWAPRLAKGEEVLLRHTLEGFNQMPPLGYCMSCERDDFVAMIDFMTQGMSAAVNDAGSEQPKEVTP